MFLVTLYQKVTKNPKKCFKNVWTLFILDQTRVSIILKTVNLDLISKSSLLTLDSSGRLIVQYTLHTLYTTQKHKIQLQKHINPLCIEIVEDFYNLKNGLEQIKSDLISKSSFFSHQILVIKANPESQLKHTVFKGFNRQNLLKIFVDE